MAKRGVRVASFFRSLKPPLGMAFEKHDVQIGNTVRSNPN
jgi:hypothetical protein